MIKPNKHLNLNYSIIKISGEIIKIFNEGNLFSYDELLDTLIFLHGEDVRYSFIQSLSLLYLLGKIEYHAESDVFEMKKGVVLKHEAK